MKQLNIFLMLATLAMITFSCEDDKDLAVIKASDAQPSTLLTPADGSTFELKLAEAEGSFEEFTWTNADYGVAVVHSYSLEMGQEINFSEPEELMVSAELSYNLTVADLNLLMYDKGYDAGIANDVYFRVNSVVAAETVDTLYSAVNKVSIKTFGYTAPNFSSPVDGDYILLLKKDEDIVIEPVTWDEVIYGSELSATYTIEFDIPGNNFADPTELLSGLTEASYVNTIGGLNQLFIKSNIEADKATLLEFRVVSSAKTKSGIIYGDPITLTIHTYKDDSGGGETRPSLYLVGNATLAEWDNTKGVEIVWDASNNVYSTITEFKAGGMKILEESGQWAPQWGDDGSFSGKLSYRPDEATTDPAEIPSPGTGIYKMTVDIDNLTYAFEAQ